MADFIDFGTTDLGGAVDPSTSPLADAGLVATDPTAADPTAAFGDVFGLNLTGTDEVPGTGQTVNDLLATGLSGTDIQNLYQSEVPGTGQTVADLEASGLTPSEIDSLLADPTGTGATTGGLGSLLDALLGIDGTSSKPKSPAQQSGTRATTPSAAGAGGGGAPKSSPQQAKQQTQPTQQKPLVQYLVQKDSSGNTQMTTIGMLVLVLLAIIIGALIFNRNREGD